MGLTGGSQGNSRESAHEPLFFAPPPLLRQASFVPRPELADEVISHLLAPAVSPDVALTTALRGAGGFGKTTLALWLCHQPEVQARFPNGVLWVDLSQKREQSQLRDLVLDLCLRISGHRPSFSDLRQASEYLGSLLDPLSVLIVLDDAWDSSDITPFLSGGPRCRRLITTRNVGALPDETREVLVDAMKRNETLAMLRYGLPEDEDVDFDDLLHRSGCWPVLLRLLNGVLREDVRGNVPLDEAVEGVVNALRERGPAFVDITDEHQRGEAVTATVEVGLEALARLPIENALECYRRLAIFPEGVDIPLATLQLYWAPVLRSPDVDVPRLARAFSRLSVVEHFDPHRSTLRLHPVIQGYLKNLERDRLPTLNLDLLEVHRARLAAPGAWHSLPPEHDYVWRNLAFHLWEARRCEELLETTTDLCYVIERAYRFGPVAVEGDLRYAQLCDRADRRVIALQSIFRGSSHRLRGFNRKTDLAATLVARVQGAEPFRPRMAQFESTLEPPYLRLRWSVVPDTELHPPIAGHEGLRCLACDALGNRVASGGEDGIIRLWHTETGTLVVALEGHDGPVNSISFDGSGTRLCSGGKDGTIRLWEVTAETARPLQVLKGHDGPVNSVRFDGKGAQIASAGADGTVRIWEVTAQSAGQVRILEGHGSYVNSVSFDYQGRFVASGGADGSVRLWEVHAAEPQRFAVPAHAGPVNSVSLDRSGRRVLSGGADGRMRMWAASSGAELRSWDGYHGEHVSSVRFDGTGSRVVSGGADGTLRIWDAESDERLAILVNCGTYVRSVACDDTGTRVLSGGADGLVRMFVPVPGQPAGPHDDQPSMVKCVSCVPSRPRVASGRRDGSVRVWDLDSGKQLVSLAGHGTWVNDVAWDGSGERVVSAGADGTARVWDAESGALLAVLEGHEAFVNSASFDLEGNRVVTAGADGTIRIWDAASGSQLQVLRPPDTDPAEAKQFNSASFDPSGTKVVSAGADNCVRIWDAASGAQLNALEGHSAYVNSARFDGDGRRVISAGYDGYVLIWDVDSGILVARLSAGTWVTSAAFDSTGQRVVFGTGDAAVHVWEPETPSELTQLRLEGSVFACGCGPEDTFAVGTGHGLYLLQLVTGAGLTPNGQADA